MNEKIYDEAEKNNSAAQEENISEKLDQEKEQENKILRHGNHAKKMSACGHQPSCSNRLGESSRLAVFLLFCRKKVFAPARWWPLLGLFQPKIPAAVAADYPLLHPGPRIRPQTTTKQAR